MPISSNISAEFLHKYFYNRGMISDTNMGVGGGMFKPVYPLLNMKTFNMKTHAFCFICHYICKNSVYIFF